MQRALIIEEALLDASETLSFLTIRTVHETKIAHKALVLFIHLFRE